MIKNLTYRIITAVILLGGMASIILFSNRFTQEVPAGTLAAEQIDSFRTIYIMSVGDAMAHSPQIKAAYVDSSESYDFLTQFKHLSPILKKADLRIVNLETTLAGPPYSGYPQFCAPDEYGEALVDAGFNFVINANNHSCDKGKKGILRTLDQLDSLAVPHTGVFRDSLERDSLYPYIYEFNELEIAILNYTYGTNGLPIPAPTIVNMIDTSKIKADLDSTRKLDPDLVVVTIHWGNEYQREASKHQKELARYIFKNGADVILGSHPHVIQPYEWFEYEEGKPAKLIAWSLGNLVSNQRRHYTNGGLLVGFRFTKNIYTGETAIDSVGYTPFWVYKESSPIAYHLLPICTFENDTSIFKMGSKDLRDFSTFISDSRLHLKRDTIRIREFCY